MASSVGIRTLRSKFSQYVRLVAAGETVLVTYRGHVVAELVPPRTAETEPVREAPCQERPCELSPVPAVEPAGDGMPSRAGLVMSLDGLMARLREDRKSPNS